MSPRSGHEPQRRRWTSRIRAFFTHSQPSRTGPLVVSREQRTVYPPSYYVELCFSDGSAAVIDPHSPASQALLRLAAQLRQTGP